MRRSIIVQNGVVNIIVYSISYKGTIHHSLYFMLYDLVYPKLYCGCVIHRGDAIINCV